MADRAARYETELRRRLGVTQAGEDFVARFGDEVIRGPFKGLRYRADGDSAIAKLVGSYEQEIAGWFEETLIEPPSRFVDLGSADGYYAVGTKYRRPEIVVHAFEASGLVRSRLRGLAKLNGVRLDSIRGKATARGVRPLLGSDTLLLVDIEGAEASLFDSSLIDDLDRTTVIVELHEGIRPGVTDALLSRFAPSHTAELVQHRDRDRDQYPEASTLSIDPNLVLGEMRNVEISWARFTPRR